jgi:hypothetical protein
MPDNVAETIPANEFNDLIAFLLTKTGSEEMNSDDSDKGRARCPHRADSQAKTLRRSVASHARRGEDTAPYLSCFRHNAVLRCRLCILLLLAACR